MISLVVFLWLPKLQPITVFLHFEGCCMSFEWIKNPHVTLCCLKNNERLKKAGFDVEINEKIRRARCFMVILKPSPKVVFWIHLILTTRGWRLFYASVSNVNKDLENVSWSLDRRWTWNVYVWEQIKLSVWFQSQLYMKSE